MSDVSTVLDLCGRLMATHRRLVCRTSFEERSVTLARGLAGLQTTAFASKRRNSAATRHLAELDDDRRLDKHELDTADPLQCAAIMARAIRNLVEGGSLDDVVIDISTFRREELLMLLAILNQTLNGSRTSCKLVYVAAKDMTPPLSGPVTKVRSIIGYAGQTKPTSPTLMVVMMGFETQRAASIIEAYEPAHVLLGMPGQQQSINDQLYEKNHKFFRELQSRSANQIGTFEFSARDPISVADTLEEEISNTSEWNVVVAPLNTKPSTLGAGIYALRNPEVQICYAQVQGYNEQSYSVAADEAFEISLDAMLEAASRPPTGTLPSSEGPQPAVAHTHVAWS